MKTKSKYKTIIVGAGLSGLTLANELLNKGHQREDLLIIERNERPGGLIKTTVEKGYITEWGPEGLRGGKPGTEKVFSFIDAKPMTLPSAIPARYIVHKGSLEQVPDGILSAVSSPLISFSGKLRVFLEPFIGKKREDETLKEFLKRRFGKGTLPLVDAVVSGIYGGTPDTLSVTHAFPFLKEAELSSGSVIIGGIKMLRRTQKNNQFNGKSKEKAPFLVKPEGGMADIVIGLAQNVDILYKSVVTGVRKTNGVFSIDVNGKELQSKNLIVATGVNGSSQISFEDIESFEKADESLISIVSLGFNLDNFPTRYPGYGFLVPSNERTFVLGTLFTSQLFPNTAPKGEVLLRVYVGGMNHLDRAMMKEEELVGHSLKDLEKLMGITDKPVFTSVQKHAPHGIPQIMMGHEKILEWKENAERKYENLFFSGIGWHSIACETLINENVELASRIKF